MADILNPYPQRGEIIGRWVGDRQRLLRHETEDYLRDRIMDYEPRQQARWNRDYSSIAAFERPVEPNRQRWCRTIGRFEPDGTDLDPVLEPWYEDDDIVAWWLTFDLLGGLRGRGILALPKNRSTQVPLVIAQHGIGSSPERVFGLDDPADIYKGYGRRLAREGFAVIAPMNISGSHPRGRIERLCSPPATTAARAKPRACCGSAPIWCAQTN